MVAGNQPAGSSDKKKYTKRDSQIIFFPQKNKIHSPYETWKLQTGTEEFLIQYSSDYINIIPYIELKITIIILLKKKSSKFTYRD